VVCRLGAVSCPAKPLKEAHVGELDVRPHGLSAVRGGRRHRQPDEIGAELVDAELRLDRESIPLPRVTGGIHWIEAHRPDDARLGHADEVDGGGPLVESITIGRREDALLDHEHPVADREVVGQILRTAGNPAFGPGERDVF